MEEFSKNGRKLRPRKSTAGTATRSEKVEYRSSENRSYGNSEHKSYGSGEKRSYGNGERKSYRNSEHRSYGNGSSEGRSYSKSSYGSNDGEHRRSYNSGNSEGRSYSKSSYGSSSGERRSYGNGERKSYGSGERRSYGSTGERRSYNSGNSEGGSYSKSRYGAKKNFRSKSDFSKASEEGINKMISRRPRVDESYGNEQFAGPAFQEEIRLNKFIANSGVCSRREADTMIQAGVVTVNGEVVTELGTKVNVNTDVVKFNGETLKGEEKVYIVMNKPKGYVTTASDPHAEKTVMELLKGCSTRVYPVGRLDKATTGVLMFTNDGEIAERLTHPSYNKKKIYQVSIDHELRDEDREKILSGITLSDGEVNADELEYIDEADHRKLGIEIHSGKNRIVRRIFESLGYNVKALDRVYFAGLTKKGLKKGEWRYLSEGEVNILKMGAYA